VKLFCFTTSTKYRNDRNSIHAPLIPNWNAADKVKSF
jgi:hypothetical protein